MGVNRKDQELVDVHAHRGELQRWTMSDLGWFNKVSKLNKINLSWFVLITAGLFSFVKARDVVIGQRKERMSLKKRVEEQVLKEREQELEAIKESRAAAEKK